MSDPARLSGPFPPVLDACCGPRMFWFDKADSRALFVDKRSGDLIADTRDRRRARVVMPDQVADFTSLPFPDDTFTLVVFDPPHTFAGPNGRTAAVYGRLTATWRQEIAAGFRECFRVLCPLGTLIFKWHEKDVKIGTVLKLAGQPPLFGQMCARLTHWVVFMKPNKTDSEL